MAIRREHVPVTEERKVLLRAGGLCESCREPTARFELDHVIPVAVGGKSDASNIQALCLRCHKRKSKKFAPKLAKAKRISRSAAYAVALQALRVILSASDMGGPAPWANLYSKQIASISGLSPAEQHALADWLGSHLRSDAW